MSADFWAGYISGAVSIIIGNPLDVLKVKLQAGVALSQSPTSSAPPPPPPPHTTNGTTSSLPSHTIPTTSSAARSSTSYLRTFLTGTGAPVLGYGALNALLFVSYNRTEAALNQFFQASSPLPLSSSTATSSTTGTNLYTTWLAGAVGGLATWVVSTPTELVKCRVQLASTSSSSSPTSSTLSSQSSWSTTKAILRTEGIRGLYFGGLVTALRDSIGYGFYFWSYELTSQWIQSSTFTSATTNYEGGTSGSNAASVLLAGGIAGIVTWASIFPLDVIKTRVQTQALLTSSPVGVHAAEREPLLVQSSAAAQEKQPRLGAWEITKQTYSQGGIKPFFRGLGVCSARAFIVNAVQWAVYEWIMAELGMGRNRNNSTTSLSSTVGGGEVVL